MSLQNLGNLLWFAPLAGIIIVLYMLRMRRKNFTVPATFLWPKNTEEIRANSLFQRLKFNWLLVLQLLALFTVLVAFARPQLRQRGLTGETTVIVLDVSASMSATDVKPSRLAEAKKIATDAIKSAKPGDRIALIEAGASPRVIFALTNDTAKQVLSLDQIIPTDGECDMGESLRLAAALVNGIDGARILLLSDGCFGKVSNFSPGKAAMVYRPVGVGGENMAFTALGASKTNQGNQLFCSIKNYGSKRNFGTVTVYGDGKVLNSIKIDVPAGKSWGDTFAVPASVRVFTAQLKADDDLKADNFAATIADPNAALSVLLVSKGDPFVEKALLLDPRVTLDRAATLPASETGAGESKYDLVIFDGVPEQSVRSRGVLTFGLPGPSSPVTRQGAMKSPQPVMGMADSNPLTRGVDLEGVYIENASAVTPIGTGKTVLNSDKGPLVVASEGIQRQIFVAFEPVQSDWPLQVSFPIFIANALDFLAGGGGGGSLSVKPGVPFSVNLTGAATLIEPNGKSDKYPESKGVTIIRDIKNVGEYQLKDAAASRTLYSVLQSDTESRLTPNKELLLGTGVVKATEAPLRFADFWRPLLVLALLILCAEWWLFARKS